jgi:hypothetical protein
MANPEKPKPLKLGLKSDHFRRNSFYDDRLASRNQKQGTDGTPVKR